MHRILTENQMVKMIAKKEFIVEILEEIIEYN
jgi:hypothetical protein